MMLVGVGGCNWADWMVQFSEGVSAEFRFEFMTAELFPAQGVLPTPEEMALLAELVPAGFKFAAHLPHSVIHGRGTDQLAAFAARLEPLADAGKLGCVLAVLPAAVDNRPEHKDFLLRVRDGLDGWPLAVEFGHKSWIVQGTEGWLREKGLCFCCVDQPRRPELVQPVLWVTGPVACARFCGRNYDDWDDPLRRHDYRYDALELAEWLPKLEEMRANAPLALVYFATTPLAQAVELARMLQRMLQPV